MYDGWLSFAGTEVGNVSRIQTYANAELPGLLKQCDCECDTLAEAIGDSPYTTAINDLAPWVDPEDESTWGFYGIMPLTITGLQDSTREYQIEENTQDGGVIGSMRHASKEWRITALLAARDEEALEAGYSWLMAVADGGCQGPCGTGMQFCYLSSCPADLEDLGTPQTSDLEVFRQRRDPDDPLDLGRHYTSRFNPPLPCGEIRWTLGIRLDPDYGSGMTPAITGEAITGVTELGSTEVLEPDQVQIVVMSPTGPVSSITVEVDEFVRDYVISDHGAGEGSLWAEVYGAALVSSATVTANTGSVVQECRDTFLRQLHNVVVAEGPRVLRDIYPSTGGALRVVEMVFRALSPRTLRSTIDIAGVDRGTLWSAPNVSIDMLDHEIPLCEVERVPWRDVLANPLCPLDPPPPLPPAATGRCLPATRFAVAYQISIPNGVVPEWTEMVPTLAIRAGDQGVYGVRVRFLANPLGLGADEIDPCSECASYAINFIPRGTTMTVDGTIERAYISVGDQTFNSRAALYSTREGQEFSWPALACGVGYLVIVEIAADSDIEELSLSLTSRE